MLPYVEDTVIMIFTIGPKNNGQKLLSFLKSELKISSSALTALKQDEKGLMVNGAHVTVRYILKEGDLLEVNEVDSPEEVNETVIPVNIPIDIIYESRDILLINKPADMPTHPSHGHMEDTLANAVAYMYKERGVPFVFRPIGRLDRNTSGISLIAKHLISASYMFYARQKELIKKRYIAILMGEMVADGNFTTISTYMKRQEDSIIVRCVSDGTEEGSFPAITHWRLLYSGHGISIVEAIPETGRTHQLRVHFAHIGHPILGDDVYGKEDIIMKRHALHAACLSLPLPYDGEIVEFISQLPNDMINTINCTCGVDSELAIKSVNAALEQKPIHINRSEQ